MIFRISKSIECLNWGEGEGCLGIIPKKHFFYCIPKAAKEKAAAAQKRKEERDEQMRVKILDANR